MARSIPIRHQRHPDGTHRFGVVLILAALSACDGADRHSDRQRYLSALKALEARPADAASLCAGLGSDVLRADCITAGVEHIAETDVDQAQALCGTISAGVGRDECFFQLAERSGEMSRCPAAGRFEDDCRMHLWGRRLRDLLPRGASPASVEATVEVELVAAGFEPDDDRPWIGVYRQIHSSRNPFDRSDCHEASTERLQALCWESGRQLYNDRLNHVRDIGHFPCDGQPLPTPLQTTPDPELADLITQRLASDLCPGSDPACVGEDCGASPILSLPEPG